MISPSNPQYQNLGQISQEITNLYSKGLTINTRTWRKRYHSVGFSNAMSKQLVAAGK